MNTPEDKHTDHEDGNGLNNQKSNLRIVTNAQNHMNKKGNRNTSSKYKGVCWNKESNKWTSSITLNQKQTHLGYFTCEKKAAKAYDKKAKELFGEYSRLNFKEE